ncbi:hypothetical protein V8G54_015748 [Vigna mungo]|uniref:Uncharacterized protein n=1 Tax=Vigna mungo TaxID=3915 RepID=A0AAQ3NLM3_VIGMU
MNEEEALVLGFCSLQRRQRWRTHEEASCTMHEGTLFCVSGLCNLQVGVAIAIFLFMFEEFLVCRLGISIRFLLDDGEAQLKIEILPWFLAARFRVSWWLGFVAWWPEGLVVAHFVLQQRRLGFHGGGTRVFVLR